MAFKKTAPTPVAPDSPEKVMLDLPRRKYPGPLLHQGEVMRTYASTAVSERDVALQLPTGSGKTLVGLMIAEWRRRKFRERIVYLCSTNQLVNQVVAQAEHYGLTVNGFTGPQKLYSQVAKSEYRNADRIAVTNYHSLFNTNPFFSDPEIILVDDAHAAEQNVAALWSFSVERDVSEHVALHSALCSVLKPLIDPADYPRLLGQLRTAHDFAWVEKIASPDLASIRIELCATIDAYADGTELWHPWSMIRQHLHACNLFVSSKGILIRPLIPPTWTHAPFTNAKQRIFMSATLGAGGDLERLTGRKSIARLAVPDGWDRQGIGRRYFVFPAMSLKTPEVNKLRRQFMQRAGRSLVLVPNGKARDAIAKDVRDNLRFPVFGAEDIEKSKTTFATSDKAVAVVANRYDGIDFPGDDCRLLFVEGLPKATNLQERFIMTRMGASALFNDRVQTRALQAIGRCTRSLQDFSAVVISGEDLSDYLADRTRRSYFHPELQAELEFGIEQSQGTSLPNMVQNLDIFLKNGDEWEDANQQILAKRATAAQKPFPSMEALRSVVNHEIEYQVRLWQGDFESAMEQAQKVLEGLSNSELKGYKALWHYLAGCAAWHGGEHNILGLAAKARLHFASARDATSSIPWLTRLSRYQPQGEAVTPNPNDGIVFRQIERVEVILAELGIRHDLTYSQHERSILEGLNGKEQFEEAQTLLGELLGFDAGKIESDASPDPWWLADSLCIVFEDHAGGQETTVLGATKARQAASHPKWMHDNVEAAARAEILPVLVTPVTKAMSGAMPHLRDVSLWRLEDFRKWARDALSTVRELRRTFVEPGDLQWRMVAVQTFRERGLDAPGLFTKLMSQPASSGLTEVP